MSGFNIVCLIGRRSSLKAPKNAELGVTGNNTPFCDFSIAACRSRLTDGKWAGVAHYFLFRIFGEKRRDIEERLHKGCLVSIQGRLEQDKWEHEGRKHSGMKIAVGRIRLLGKAERGGLEPELPDITLSEDIDVSESGQEGE
jgi:single-stranded DNA-binding protein